MKVKQFLSSSALLSCAAAQGAYLYTVDQSTQVGRSMSAISIDSDTALSIVARRCGNTDSKYLRSGNAEVLADIEKYSGSQQPLFSNDGAGMVPPKLFIRLSGYDGAISMIEGSLPDLWIEDPTTEFLDDFFPKSKGNCEYKMRTMSKDIHAIYSFVPKGESCPSNYDLEMSPTMLAINARLPKSAADIPISTSGLMRMLMHFAATENVESTLLILPSASKLAAPKKPAYKKNPQHQHKHAARSLSEVESDNEGEEPLDLPSSIPLHPEQKEHDVPVALDDFSTSSKSSNSTHPLPAVIPVCYSSISACENTTNICSGHGSCYKAHTGCYKCKCGRTTVREYDNGSKKTIQWGGAACQKKDVSVPFILFASIGVAGTALVAGGIGLLFSMGSQTLPSVLGAGVGGPRAQK